jgi:hypothetical protein
MGHPARYNPYVADRLYLSCWIRGFNESSMTRHFEKFLGLFRFSRLARRGPVLRIYAMERVEPPQMEREFPIPPAAAQEIGAAREFARGDSCIEVDASWDLWQFDTDWKLTPSPATLLCLGPEFEDTPEFEDSTDHLRVEFGPDAPFLPIEGVEGSLQMGQSNLKSLLHFVSEIEKNLPVEKRKLWSESGGNFAELVTQRMGGWDEQS